MNDFTPKTGLIRAVIPALLVAGFIAAGCSSSTDLDVSRIVKTDTITKPARPALARGTASFIAAADTSSYYILAIDSIRRFDTVTRNFYGGLDSVRPLNFTPDAPATAVIDTAASPNVLWLSGSWTASYPNINTANFYPLQINSAAIILDSVSIRPGQTFTATPLPPNPSVMLLSLTAPFPPNTGVFPSLRFTVLSAAPPKAGKPGSIVIGVEGSTQTIYGGVPLQGSIVLASIALRMGATLTIAY